MRDARMSRVGLMFKKEFLVAGHSHIFSMGAPFNYRGERALLPTKVGGRKGFFFIDKDAWPVTTEYFEELIDRANGKDVVLSWGGSQNIMSFLFEPEVKFDFFAGGDETLADGIEAIIPKALVQAHEERFVGPLRGVLAKLRSTAASTVLVGTMPPRPDIAETFADSIRQAPAWRALAEENGVEIDRATVVSPAMLKKLWRVSQEQLEGAALEAGAIFLPVPEAVFDENGFLAEKYWTPNDFTHANADYGALMLKAALGVKKRRAEATSTSPALGRESTDHPYRHLASRSFWRTGVSQEFDASTLVAGAPLIAAGEKVVSAGSCFAANIVPYLEASGISYVRTERVPEQFSHLAKDDNFSYAKFSASYGNIYTVRQALQLLQRCLGRFKPAEDRWRAANGSIVDPFRPGLKYPAQSDVEFDALLKQHLDNVLRAIREADVFVFTLGLTEAWVSKVDGAVFPACPGTVAGRFDPDKYVFKNFTAREVSDDLDAFVAIAREIRPDLRIVLTVSPVPLVATATSDHVLVATTYSKSVLRVAAGEVEARHDKLVYFPAYEIVTGPQAPHDFFEDDRREPTEKAIRTVMHSFLSRCDVDPASLPQLDGATPAPDASSGAKIEATGARKLSEAIANAFCEEAAVER
jgi:hypothetical protein